MSKLSLQFDNYDLEQFVELTRQFGHVQFSYVVTPNTDHIIRYFDDPTFRELYRDARYVLLDSRFLSYVLRLTHAIHAPVCAGSDLTAKLFADVIRPEDRIVLVGGTNEQAQRLRELHQINNLRHHNPPMGFSKDPAAIETCLRFIETNSPFRFCFIAVGSPQQELVAQKLKTRDRARGLALCVGASIDFLTGEERRAPKWMQSFGCEWLYRLSQNPRRLAKRYLIRGPRVFNLLRKLHISIRSPQTVAEQPPV